MNSEIRKLEPHAVWNYFADLNAVPRASKKEEKVIGFMLDFGKKLNLETIRDEVGNVLIRKPATPGFENRKTVVLQSHLDMVHQKNRDVDFDFDTQGIKMLVDGDWVRAKGTTLGADNGLGVAAIMAVLASDSIEHPALEALFTVDEETGMTGAKGLKSGFLEGEILLNLDTEEDDEIGIGCAGGVDITATGSYDENPVSAADFYRIEIKGLQGGHSGMDIIKGLGNANKIMNRLLLAGNDFIQIASIDGGGLRNAIPRESTASFLVRDYPGFSAVFEKTKKEILSEYRSLEPGLLIEFKKAENSGTGVMDKTAQTRLLQALAAAPNGVYRMSPDIEDLVEASNNLAQVLVSEGKIKISCLTRSSVESSKADLAASLTAAFELAGFEVKLSGDYPGWKPNMDSEILQVLDSVYQKLNKGERANIAACHAGLECGILGQNYPEMDMISFGPTIKGAHSPDERAQISSTEKFWVFLQEILKNIPGKN